MNTNKKEQVSPRYFNGFLFQIEYLMETVKLHFVDNALQYALKVEEKCNRIKGRMTNSMGTRLHFNFKSTRNILKVFLGEDHKETLCPAVDVKN